MNKTKRPKYIDFHTHTEFSDGISSPEHLARVAALQELDYLAITDHDMIDGYERCKKEAQKWGIKVIPGVEISTDKYHILGLGINTQSEQFKRFLDYSAQEQKRVSISRIEILRNQGVPITLEKLEEAFPHSRLGKMNLYMTLLQDEECRNFFLSRGEKLLDSLYKKYLKNAREKSSDDKNIAITPQRAIQEIHNAGGIAIIAHPFKEIKDMSEMDLLKKYGLDGIEIQPAHNGRNEPFIRYAQENDMLVTYGSDWHAGLFERTMLSGRNNGENVLYQKLAEKLKIE